MKTLRFAGRRGFTLIEMIITLCVFLLLVGAVFGIFDATLQSASSLQDDQRQADQSAAFHAWLTRTFLRLPVNASLVSYRREGVPFDVSDLVWNDSERSNALDLHLQPDGHYTLRLATAPAAGSLTDFRRAVLQDEPTLAWRPLLRDLAAADWRFYQQADAAWHDSATGGPQLIVQFTYQTAGTSRALVDDCWIPPLAAPAGFVTSGFTANP